MFSGHVGVDPYTTAVSDVYQDLFHEGSYVGKGIYDVDAFEAALGGRVPENALLSHDLFEGFYARAALCTDIQLVDDYPSHYLAFAARQHRWVRGDWQIVRWLWRTVPDANGRTVPNTLPVIARWKILDNLRRSLMPPALVALLVAGWTMPAGVAGVRGRRWRCWCSRFRRTSRSAGRIGEPRARVCRCANISARRRDTHRHERCVRRVLDRHAGASERRDARRHRPRARARARSRATACSSGCTADRAATTDALGSPPWLRQMWPAPALAAGDRRAGVHGRAWHAAAGQLRR